MIYFTRAVTLFVLLAAWLALSVYGGVSGWWLSAIAPKNNTELFVTAIDEKIKSQNQGNTAFILIEDGKIATEKYYSNNDKINGDTLFPLASMSKLFAAYGVMQLVEDGKINLDEPIENYLTRWHLPENEFDNNLVTTRLLLSHTAGLTDGLGFGDYTAEESLPSIEESLQHPRASADENKVIAVGIPPATQWQYSGGGYLILELLIEEVTGKPFADWMQTSVFNPLDMDRSTYNYLGDLTNTANIYNENSEKIPFFQYASNAATGLSSSPNDLAKFIAAFLDQDANINKPMSDEYHKLMREPTGYVLGAPIWGLGAMLYAPTNNNDFVFGHDGANSPAINTALRIEPNGKDAIIVLASGNAQLASTVGYEWTLWKTGYPDFLAFDSAVKSALVPASIGCLIIVILFIVFLKSRSQRNKI
ncbi:serine hydrolase domain-containing protein [Sessilibacter sp. MAH4]